MSRVSRVPGTSFRDQINQSIVAFDLLPGLQSICKNHFRGFPDYQLRIIRECFKTCPEPSIILGGREIGKTFPLMVGFLLRALTTSDYELFMVPGKKIDQAKTALKYVQILTKKSSVVKPLSGLDRSTGLEWSSEIKAFENGSILKALAPNEGVLSEHGNVWSDEYQSLPDPVDEALQGFINRVGDRMIMSGTAQIRGSPLHRAYLVALQRYPGNVVETPVQPAIDAGILSRESVESKKRENGGKLSPIMFDAWFNCKFPNLSTMGWHPQKSYLDLDDPGSWSHRIKSRATGCDPGIIEGCTAGRFVNGVTIENDEGQHEYHLIGEFELMDTETSTYRRYGTANLLVEDGHYWGGGYNTPYQSILKMSGIPYRSSGVDGDDREDLFERGFTAQALGRLFVHPGSCESVWSACEQQTFDDKNEMDRLPLTHWIFCMLHCMRGLDLDRSIARWGMYKNRSRVSRVSRVSQ